MPVVTGSINTINPSIQVSGAFAGSAGSASGLPPSKKLSLQEAVQRGLQYNLGAVGMSNAVRQARGRQRVARSSLFPNLNGYLRDSVQQLNLKAQGLGSIAIPFSGFSFPTVVGPFDYFGLRGSGEHAYQSSLVRDRYCTAPSLECPLNWITGGKV